VIDSVQVKPVFDRIDFYGLDLRDFAMQSARTKISMANGRVGVIMSYSTKGPPTEVSVTWDKFNDVIKSVDSVVFAFDKTEKTEFSTFLQNNTYRWHEPNRPPLASISNVAAELPAGPARYIRIPLLTAGLIASGAAIFIANLLFGRRAIVWFSLAAACVVAAVFAAPYLPFYFPNPAYRPPVIPEQKAQQIFSQLHKNLFRAFDYSQESDIYDALANSVDGQLLRTLYLQINESLKVKEQGGAISRIDEVRIVDGETAQALPDLPLDGVGFAYRCNWDLVGTVEHWGHIHQRTNKYDAIFNVQVCDNAWKITGMQMLDEVTGPVKTSVRKF
jgi:hypothetical protein